jgi:hypothetical protein
MPRGLPKEITANQIVADRVSYLKMQVFVDGQWVFTPEPTHGINPSQAVMWRQQTIAKGHKPEHVRFIMRSIQIIDKIFNPPIK